MRVLCHRRSPGVEHGGDADAGTEDASGSACDGDERLRRRTEQQIVDDGLVLHGDVGNRGRQREDELLEARAPAAGRLHARPARCLRSSALALGAVTIAAANQVIPISCLAGKFSNGESAQDSAWPSVGFEQSCSPLPCHARPEGIILVRASEGRWASSESLMAR